MMRWRCRHCKSRKGFAEGGIAWAEGQSGRVPLRHPYAHAYAVLTRIFCSNVWNLGFTAVISFKHLFHFLCLDHFFFPSDAFMAFARQVVPQVCTCRKWIVRSMQSRRLRRLQKRASVDLYVVHSIVQLPQTNHKNRKPSKTKNTHHKFLCLDHCLELI